MLTFIWFIKLSIFFSVKLGSATAINMKYDSMHELKTDKSRLSVNSYSLFFPNSSHKYLTSFDSIKVRLEKHQLLPSINDITNNKIHIDKFDPKAEQMKPVHFKPFTISIGNCNTKPNTITPVKVDNTNESKKKDTLVSRYFTFVFSYYLISFIGLISETHESGCYQTKQVSTNLFNSKKSLLY